MDFLETLVQDTLQGSLWRTDAGTILVLGEVAPMPDTSLIAQGDLTLRYAIPYLGRAQASVVPGLFVSERGAQLAGWEGWNFAVRNYQLYPRSEIYGLSSDGSLAQVFLRELDFGAEVRVLAYDRAEAYESQLPLAQVDYMLVGEGAAAPDLVTYFLPPPPSEG